MLRSRIAAGVGLVAIVGGLLHLLVGPGSRRTATGDRSDRSPPYAERAQPLPPTRGRGDRPVAPRSVGATPLHPPDRVRPVLRPDIDDGDPTDAELAAEYLENEEFDDARALAMACLDDDEQNDSCWQTLLFSYTRTGRFEEARPLLEDCLLQRPDDLTCLSGMTTQLLRDGDLQGAKTLVERILVLAPASVPAFLSEAQWADRSGDRVAAVGAYERACSFGQEFACRRAEQLRDR